MASPDRVARERNLIELTVDALDDLQASRDLDWVVCWQVRQWEAALDRRCDANGVRLKYGRFDFHRWADICYLVRTRAYRYVFQELQCDTSALTIDDVREYNAFLRDTTADVCDQAFATLAEEIDRLGLDVWS